MESAALLFRRHGIDGTSFSDVIAHSGAPRGSIYHHFPAGKAQLAAETTQWAGQFILASTVAALAENDPVGAIEASSRWWTKLLRSSDYEAGCVIAAATVEGVREPAVRAAAAQAFTDWEKVLAQALRQRGVATPRARSVATLVVAAIEGAVILARAQRSTEPLLRVTRELQAIVADSMP